MPEYCWEEVINKYFELQDSAHVRAAVAVCGNDRFSSYLAISRFPQHAGINEGRGLALRITVLFGVGCELHERDHVLERRRQAGLLDRILEIGQAVFDG